MRFLTIDVDQRSPAWHEARIGRVTSSRANAMLSEGKGGKDSTQRRNLRVQLALEQITGRVLDSDYQSPAMAQGVEREATARRAYEAATGHLVMTSGFLQHPELMAGASLDGYIGDYEGVLEVKSPIPATHLEFLNTGKVPLEYMRQITHQIYISGAEWADYASWCPEFPEKARLKVIHVLAADIDLTAYELMLMMFLREVEALRDEINELPRVGCAAVQQAHADD